MNILRGVWRQKIRFKKKKNSHKNKDIAVIKWSRKPTYESYMDICSLHHERHLNSERCSPKVPSMIKDNTGTW